MAEKGVYRFVVVLFLAFVLGGCAGIHRQAFNKEANQSVRRIGILEQHEQEKYFVENLGHPGMSFGLIGGLIAVADTESKKNKFTELMKARNFNAVEEFQKMLLAELENAGYATKLIKPARAKHDLLKKYDGLDEEVDGYLDFTLGAGYACKSSFAEYMPMVHSVVRLVKRESNEILYQEVIYYGYKFEQGEAACFTAEEQYYFKDFKVLTAQADIALEGLRKGLSLIAKHIGQSLQR